MSRYTAVPLVSAYSNFSPSRWWALPCITVNKTSVEDCNVGHLHQHPPPPQVCFRCCHMLAGSYEFFFFLSCFTWRYYSTELMVPCKVSEWLMSMIMSQFQCVNKRTSIMRLSLAIKISYRTPNWGCRGSTILGVKYSFADSTHLYISPSPDKIDTLASVLRTAEKIFKWGWALFFTL